MRKHMSWTTRLIIEKLYNSGYSYRYIAKETGYVVSSVYHEIQRGLYDHLGAETTKRPRRYSAQIAQEDADWKQTIKGRPIKLGNNYAYAQTVALRIAQGESIDQITGTMKKNNQWTVSTSTLYRYVENGYIPGIEKRKPKRSYNAVKASRPPKGKSIESRPPEISTRSAAGHWEMDLVIGKAEGQNEAFLTLIERKTRYLLMSKLPNKTTNVVTKALRHHISNHPPGTFQTITVDNGSEFQDYKTMKTLVNEVYYCHPYSSWERGTNENVNRIIRRYFPKGQSLKKVTQDQCNDAAKAINRMHRKILNYQTAEQQFIDWQLALISV